MLEVDEGKQKDLALGEISMVRSSRKIDLSRRQDKMCGNKRPYATREAALSAVEDLESRTGDVNRMVVYKCHYCDQFHFGHLPGSKRLKK
jgi:hypothetical protein